MHLRTKPRIAILSIRNTYSFGGVFATLKVVHAFCEQYFEPTVFVLGFDQEISAHIRPLKFTSTTRSFNYFGMKCVEIGSRWAFWEPGHYQFTESAWEEALADFDYFFVVSATPIAGHPVALLGKKFIAWLSTSYQEDRTERVKQLKGLSWGINTIATPAMAIIEKQILSQASYVLALSKYSLNEFKQRVPEIITKSAICGYPIDNTKIVPLKKSSKLTLLAVGRFSDPRKNLPMLLRVFDGLVKQLGDITLYIVGQQPSAELLYEFTGLPSYDRVVFTGQVSKHDLAILYQQAHLMLISSYQEGFGISGLEGLLYGMPIVSTDCGGVRDYVLNNITGYLVPINDDAAMIAQSLAILTDATLRERLASSGQELVKTLFSQEKIYGMFKHALSVAYPELIQYFTDREHLDTLNVHTKHITPPPQSSL